jgi:hypothetical protein
MRADELGHREAVASIRDVIVPIARESRLGNWFVRNLDKVGIDDPEVAVLGQPLFEILPDVWADRPLPRVGSSHPSAPGITRLPRRKPSRLRSGDAIDGRPASINCGVEVGSAEVTLSGLHGCDRLRPTY